MSSLYTQDFKNFIMGVSQQPDRLRYPEQLEYQENGFSTEVSGLQKRPPTIRIKNLGDILVEGKTPFVHFIDRDENEKYFAVMNGESIQIFDLKGKSYNVSYNNGTKQYITTDTPRETLAVQTIADYSFFINKTTKVAMSSTLSPNVWSWQGGLVNVKSGQYARTYQIIVDGTTVASYQTPDGQYPEHTQWIDTNSIASALATQLHNNGFNTYIGGESWIYFTKQNGALITSLVTKDGFDGEALVGFLQSCQRFTDLPATAPDGYVIEVTGEPSSTSDNYYVKYNSSRKVWEETVAPNLQVSFNLATMPHNLIRNADNTFTFSQSTWEDRTVGDNDSNPLPSFVGQALNDVFFHRNRIGILAGENVVLSQSRNLFNFWMTTATDVIDTDPIDLTANHPERVCNLDFAVPFSQELVLFSDRAQFVLDAEGTMTPASAQLSLATDYAFSPYASPVSAGRNIYFSSERHEFATVREFYTMQNISEGKAADDVTNYVPSYIPKGVHQFISGATENMILVLTEGDESRIYVYKYLFQEEAKRQSSWSFWSFGEDAKVLGGGFVGSTLYLLIQRPEGVILEKMIFTYYTQDFDEEPYRVYLDRKVLTSPLASERYDADTNQTKVVLSDYYDNYLPSTDIALVFPDGKYREITEEEAEEGVVWLQGDLQGQQLIVGYKYPFKIILSKIMVRSYSDNGAVKAEPVKRLQLRKGWLNYANTGYFKVIVEYQGKPSSISEMTGRMLGVTSYIDQVQSKEGSFSFGIFSNSDNCRVVVENETPLPISLIGGGWEGLIYRRSRPI